MLGVIICMLQIIARPRMLHTFQKQITEVEQILLPESLDSSDLFSKKTMFRLKYNFPTILQHDLQLCN